MKDTSKLTSSSAAAATVGVRSGKFHITVDFIGNVFRTSTAGSSERNSYGIDWVHGLIGYVRPRSLLYPTRPVFMRMSVCITYLAKNGRHHCTRALRRASGVPTRAGTTSIVVTQHNVITHILMYTSL